MMFRTRKHADGRPFAAMRMSATANDGRKAPEINIPDEMKTI